MLSVLSFFCNHATTLIWLFRKLLFSTFHPGYLIRYIGQLHSVSRLFGDQITLISYSTDIQTDRHTAIRTDIQTDRHTEIRTDIQTDRHTEIRTDIQTDRHTGIRTDIQTDRHTEIRTDTCTKIQSSLIWITLHQCLQMLVGVKYNRNKKGSQNVLPSRSSILKQI